MFAGLGLARRREDRPWQPRRLLEPGRELDAAGLSARLVVAPARTDQVAAYDRLDRQRSEPAYDQRPPLELLGERRVVDDVADGDVRQVVFDQVGHAPKPEQRDLRQDLALARHRVGQDDVVGRQPVGRDNQQVIVVDAVDVADLATADQRQLRDL